MTSPLPALTQVIDLLGKCSLALSRASRWADRDRVEMSPLALLGGPLKYWKWQSAKRHYTRATKLLGQVREQVPDVFPDASVTFSKLEMLNDVFDVFPVSVNRVGTKGGPSPIKQQLGVETTAYHRIETARLEVDNLMAEVGALHAKLRAAS